MQLIDGSAYGSAGAGAGGAAGGLSLGGLGSLLKVGGGIVGAIGTLSAGKATAKSVRQKAAASRMEGREAKRVSDYRVRLIYREGGETMGAIEAETGKSGLAMTGTPLMSLVDTARETELAAALESRAGTITQGRYEQAASAYESDAREVKKASKFAALSGLLGG